MFACEDYKAQMVKVDFVIVVAAIVTLELLVECCIEDIELLYLLADKEVLDDNCSKVAAKVQADC